MIITESKLNSIIAESIKKHLNEDFFDSFQPTEAKKDGAMMTGQGYQRRKRVISYLKSDGVNVAAFAYSLWPDKDKDSARSYFYKCLNGEKNDNGTFYNFSDDEINSLYNKISSHSI